MAQVNAPEIDKINIRRASLKAMADSVSDVLQQLDKSVLVLVDGQDRLPLEGIRQEALIKGDQRSLNIAAASVLAKVARDRIMVAFDKKFPGYGLAKHKGYPTKAHKEALVRLGPSSIHRKTFRGVK